MNVSARVATVGDLPDLLHMYRLLAAEMVPLEGTWPTATGLPAPEDEAFTDLMASGDSTVLIGEMDGTALGFLIGAREALPPQARGARIGSVRYIFTEPGAREIGVGEAMLEAYLALERDDGIALFDAHVAPGHRLTKNFFESKGFSARSIVMHRNDEQNWEKDTP